MSYFKCNLKYLRKIKSLTQSDFANKIGISRPIIGSYEEGRAEPKLATLQNISHFFKVSIDDILEKDLSLQKSIAKKKFENNDVRVLPIIVNEKQEERITIVPVKASAGYLNGFSDPEFIEELPKFYLPFSEFSQGTHRAFQIQGESMKPIASDSYILAEYLENWSWIQNGECYVLITKEDGIVYKRVFNHLNVTQSLELKSDNPEYETYFIDGNQLLEVWKAKAFLSFDLPVEQTSSSKVDELSQMMLELKKEVNQLKFKK